MRPSLRFAATLSAIACLSAAASLAALAWQDRRESRDAAEQLAEGSVASGRLALQRYGCGGCHVIRGVEGAAGRAGPALDGIAVRAQIAGRLSNRPANLVRWIRHPQEVDPGNGMPDLSVSESDARDMAAFLYTLKSSH